MNFQLYALVCTLFLIFDEPCLAFISSSTNTESLPALEDWENVTEIRYIFLKNFFLIRRFDTFPLPNSWTEYKAVNNQPFADGLLSWWGVYCYFLLIWYYQFTRVNSQDFIEILRLHEFQNALFTSYAVH